MKLIIFTVHDSKAEQAPDLYTSTTQATGLRRFKATCDNPESDFYKFPGDYTLFELGTWDQKTLKIEEYKTPIHHGLALQFKEAERPFVSALPPRPPDDGRTTERSRKAKDMIYGSNSGSERSDAAVYGDGTTVKRNESP